jgi:hypothetical protein
VSFSWHDPQLEADLAAALFQELRTVLVAQAASGRVTPRVSVGVITPYRQQRRVLRETFERVVGVAAAREVGILSNGRQISMEFPVLHSKYGRVYPIDRRRCHARGAIVGHY